MSLWLRIAARDKTGTTRPNSLTRLNKEQLLANNF